MLGLTKGEIISSDNNISTNNINNYNIYNDKQSYNIATTTTTTTTISIPSTNQEDEKELLLPPFAKRILIINDDPDITLTFKKCLEAQNNNKNNKTFLKVYTYNNPLEALSKFKPNFYDLLLIDINMPIMNGFELSTKILEIDLSPRILLYVIRRDKLRSIKRTVSNIKYRMLYYKARIRLD